MLSLSDLELANRVYIKSNEVESFKSAWENLMASFVIPTEHQAGLFEVMLNFFSTLDHYSLYIYEINCSIDALDFLIKYSKRFEEAVKGKKPIEIDSYAKVKFELAALPFELVYPDISQITFKALYQHFRSYDNFLRQSLHPYKLPPSVEILNNLRRELGEQRDYNMQFDVIQLIEQLKGYINEHLSSELSRKVNYFIFELLYLFNILQYGGKVNKSDCAKFKLKNESVKSKFLPLVSLSDSQKSNTVKAIIINAAKVNEYHNSKPGSKVEN